LGSHGDHLLTTILVTMEGGHRTGQPLGGSCARRARPRGSPGRRGARSRCSSCSATRTAVSAPRRSTTACAGQNRSVGLASVYRALDALAQLQLVHRIDVGGHRLLRARRPQR
jgi:hypothetical protein